MKTTIRSLLCKLSEDEVADYSKDLARQTQTVSCLEEEKKSVAAEYSSKISRHKANISDLARKITAGQEMRDVECEWKYDWETGVKVLHRLDTFIEIDRDTIKEFERQPELELEDETGVAADEVDGDSVDGDGSGSALPDISPSETADIF